ncbi:MAG: hypothetical protein KBT46_02400 [Ruminococcus sp.]|nr:hypothetical protein [Candidatus Copronaster equi]
MIPDSLYRDDYLVIFSVMNFIVGFLYYTFGAYCDRKLRFKFKRVKVSRFERAYFNICGYRNELDRLYSKKRRRYKTFGIIYFAFTEFACYVGVDVLYKQALTCNITLIISVILLLILAALFVYNKTLFKNKTTEENKKVEEYKKEYAEFEKEVNALGKRITLEGLYNGEYFEHEDVEGFTEGYNSENVKEFLEDRLVDSVTIKKKKTEIPEQKTE